MPANYVLLERIELNASAASVTFSNIPQSGYTDLKIVYSARSNDNSSGWNLTRVQFNTDTTAGNYNYRVLGGFGSTAYSGYGTQAVGYTTAGGRTANTFGNGEIYIPNYLGSTQKSYSGDSVTEGNGSTYEILGFHAALWSGTAAINQIILSLDNSASFVANSTFSLYGLAAVGTTPVIAPKATGGNITSDGTYWIHTFNSTGTFTPLQGLSCDYLVVAGGGGGNSGYPGGGGGAGGFRTGNSFSVNATAYTITVGSGGAAYTSNGSDSTFSTITSTGGGKGGADGSGVSSGASGGSGGGGGSGVSVAPGGAGNTPSTSPSQGNNGGNGNWSSGSYGYSGGGGGAGAAGGSATSSLPGNGGNGSSSSISGTSVTYAGGGGGGSFNVSTSQAGGTGGTGGGGNGGAGFPSATSGAAGTVNTGGGGGGGYAGAGNGGSGIVIIRYPIA